jgi:hypothetical protein
VLASISQRHDDALAVQVVGQKLVWLAPPDVFSPEDAVDGNTSTLDIFDESIKGSQRAGRAHQMGMKAVLGPGDILILPPGWWHAMRSLSRVSFHCLLHTDVHLLTHTLKSFSVSLWY